MLKNPVCSNCKTEMYRVYNEQGNGIKKTHKCPNCGNARYKMICEEVIENMKKRSDLEAFC